MVETTVIYVHESALSIGGSGSNAQRKLELLRAAGYNVKSIHLPADSLSHKASTVARSIALAARLRGEQNTVVYARLTAASFLLSAALSGRVPLVLEMNGFLRPEEDVPLGKVLQRRLVESTYAGDESFRRHTEITMPTSNYHVLPLGVAAENDVAPERVRGGAVWVGFMKDGQGLLDLVDAWASSDTDQVLTLAGDGPLESAVRERIETYPDRERFVLLGRVDRDEARTLLAQSELAIASYEASLGVGHPISSLKTLDYLLHCPRVISTTRDTALWDLSGAAKEGVFLYEGSGSDELRGVIHKSFAAGIPPGETVIGARREALFAARGPAAQIERITEVINFELNRFGVCTTR